MRTCSSWAARTARATRGTIRHRAERSGGRGRRSGCWTAIEITSWFPGYDGAGRAADTRCRTSVATSGHLRDGRQRFSRTGHELEAPVQETAFGGGGGQLARVPIGGYCLAAAAEPGEEVGPRRVIKVGPGQLASLSEPVEQGQARRGALDLGDRHGPVELHHRPRSQAGQLLVEDRD